MKKHIILIVIALSLLTACGHIAEQPYEQIDFGELFADTSNSSGPRLYDQLLFDLEAENGIYFMDDMEMINYYDFGSQQTVLVCNKPGCAHERWGSDTTEEERCSAHLGYSCIFHTGFFFDGKLYILTSDMEQRGRLLRSELDRSDQEVIAEFDTSWFGYACVFDGTVYFSGSMPVFETYEEGVQEMPKETTFWLYGVDLRTGEVMELTERRTEYNVGVSVISAEGERLYLCVTYCKNYYDGTNWDEADSQTELYEYNVKTKELKTLDVEMTSRAGGPILVSKGWVYLMEMDSTDSPVSRITAVNMETGERRTICEDAYAVKYDRNAGIIIYTLEDEYRKNIYIYDTAAGQTVKQKAMDGFYDIDFLDSYVYGYYGVSPDGSFDGHRRAVVTKATYWHRR